MGTIVLMGALAALYVFPGSINWIQEINQSSKQKVYRAQADITVLQEAVGLYYKEYRKYPISLNELTKMPPQKLGYFQVMGKIPIDPWGHQYDYEIVPGPDGSIARITSVPDEKTRSKIGINKLSSETNWGVSAEPSPVVDY